VAVCGRSLPTLVINDTMAGIGVSTALRRVPLEFRRRLLELSGYAGPSQCRQHPQILEYPVLLQGIPIRHLLNGTLSVHTVLRSFSIFPEIVVRFLYLFHATGQ
jgi:hypothetical protein